MVIVGKNSEIFVKLNFEYKEFCYLVFEEEVFDFFKYLDVKKENFRFIFKFDINKDYRKVVYYFVNKKFGNFVEIKFFFGLNYNVSNLNVVIIVRFREKVYKYRKRFFVECSEGKVIYIGN